LVVLPWETAAAAVFVEHSSSDESLDTDTSDEQQPRGITRWEELEFKFEEATTAWMLEASTRLCSTLLFAFGGKNITNLTSSRVRFLLSS
jgi:hypothetical protein